jgi:multiple sugar transport system substrate-binding protein
VSAAFRRARPVLALALVLALGGCGAGQERGPVTLVFKYARILGNADPLPELLRAFEAAHPGVRVKGEALPWTSDDQHQFYIINLEGRSPGFDLMMLDCIWVPEFARAGWLLDLTPHLQPGELAPFFPERGRLGHVRRARVGAAVELQRRPPLLPHRSPGEVRPAPARDLRGADRPGAPIRAGERDPRLDGYVWQGKQYEGLVVNVLEALWANGARVLGEDGAIFPEPQRAADALRFLRSLIESGVSPAWTTAADEELSRRAFGDGHAIFLRNWPYAMDLFEGKDSAVRGRVAFAALPGPRAGRAGRRLDGRRASRRVAPEPAPRSRAGARAASHERSRPARDRAGRCALADPSIALPRPRAHARSPGDATAAGAGPRRPPAPGDAVLSLALIDAPAGVLGGDRRGEAGGARGRRRRRTPALLPRGDPMTGRERADQRRALVYIAPTVLALGVLTVYPGIWVLWLSLQRRIPIFEVSRFAGFENYAFLAVDARFWSAGKTTAVFTVGSVALEIALGVAVALAITPSAAADGWRSRCCCSRGRCRRSWRRSSSSGSITRRPAS